MRPRTLVHAAAILLLAVPALRAQQPAARPDRPDRLGLDTYL